MDPGSNGGVIWSVGGSRCNAIRGRIAHPAGWLDGVAADRANDGNPREIEGEKERREREGEKCLFT